MSSPVLDVIRRFDLEPHPEGGWYREYYRSAALVETPRGARSAGTAIHYLLAAGQVSRWHTLLADEVWHFYRGDPLELLTYDPASRRLIRTELSHRETGVPTTVVAAGLWQAARPLGAFALAGCTMAPGFEFQDFRLVASIPEHTDHLQGPFGEETDLL